MNLGRRISRSLLVFAYDFIFNKWDFSYRFADSHISDLSENVVDLGGGPGLLSNTLFKKGASYIINIDLDYHLLMKSPSSVDRILASSEDEIFRESSIGDVIMHDSLHHFEKPVETIRTYGKISRCLHIIDFDKSRFGGKVLSFLEKIIGFGSNFFELNELISILKSYGFEKIELYMDNGFIPRFYLKTCINEDLKAKTSIA